MADDDILRYRFRFARLFRDYRDAFGEEVPAIARERIFERAHWWEISLALASAIETRRPIQDWSFCMGAPRGRDPQYRERSFRAVVWCYIGSFGTVPTRALEDAARRGDLLPVIAAMAEADRRDEMLEGSEPFVDLFDAYCNRLVRLLRSAESTAGPTGAGADSR